MFDVSKKEKRSPKKKTEHSGMEEAGAQKARYQDPDFATKYRDNLNEFKPTEDTTSTRSLAFIETYQKVANFLLHKRLMMAYHLYKRKTVRGHIMLWVMRCWLLYHGIGQSSMSTLVSESIRYVRYNDLTLKCDSDLLPLTSSSANNLVCAIKCTRQPGCTAFMFTRNNSSVQDATCSWCPANDVVGIIYTPANPLLETWVKILGHLVFPNNPVIKELVPSTLSLGRVLFFQARVPDPVPDRCIFSLDVDDTSSIAVRMEIRFSFEYYYKRVGIFTLINSGWTDHYFPTDFFPFSAGQKLDIAVLGRSEGFQMYLNGEYLHFVWFSRAWVGQINLLHFINFEDVMVTF
ncbi:galectin-8 [Plakobranchus ocellatus]|uniref:Galectin n=1 Tax=Plakobranchus ocellatus TaxID=259542 RepID=A0AAV4CBD0_9GAST|nr:galectin-8 [Plakobranchus ocellatus]